MRTFPEELAMLLAGVTLFAWVTALRADLAPTAASALASDLAAPGERAMEGRLMAPCCWAQTLDVHESEIALELRREIRVRLLKGEAERAIEADLIERYGPRMAAVPPGDPLKTIALVVVGAATLTAFAIWKAVKTWLKRAAAAEPSQAGARDEWDDRLDAELAREDAAASAE